MTPCGIGAVDGPRYRRHVACDGLGLMGGVQGTGTPAGLHDTGHPRQPRNQPAALKEPVPGRCRARGLFGNDQTAGPERGGEVGVPFPVNPLSVARWACASMP